MNINLYLEDWDNAELSSYDWNEQMEEAVEMYNQEYGTDHAPRSTVRAYLSWKRDQNSQLNEI